MGERDHGFSSHAVTNTTVSRQIYPLSRYCPGQNLTPEPAPSTPLTKKGKRNKRSKSDSSRRLPERNLTGREQARDRKH